MALLSQDTKNNGHKQYPFFCFAENLPNFYVVFISPTADNFIQQVFNCVNNINYDTDKSTGNFLPGSV